MSTPIDTTVKGSSANSYCSVARADEILGARLYATAWTSASDEPDAAGWLANGGATAGARSIDVDTGTGLWTKESRVRFAGHSTVYAVTSPLRTDGALKIEPALTADVADDAVVERLTANDREAALVWATRLLDQMMRWYGSKRTEEQRLRWPRSGVVDADGYNLDFDLIPELLEEATAELALSLLERNRFEQPGLLGQGIEEARLGPIAVKVGSEERIDVVPQNILSLLSPLGYLEPEAQHGAKMLPLYRS